jgi:hypothetical protein
MKNIPFDSGKLASLTSADAVCNSGKFKEVSMGEDEREGGIKVKDKRRFDSEGEARAPDEDTGEKQAEAKVEAEDKAKEEPRPEPAGAKREGLPPIDFPTFILSLATSAQVHLGAIANPQTGKSEMNLPLAKETIDLLEILKEKTKGNLSNDEERLFEHLLYDLRMMYVEKDKQGK